MIINPKCISDCNIIDLELVITTIENTSHVISISDILNDSSLYPTLEHILENYVSVRNTMYKLLEKQYMKKIINIPLENNIELLHIIITYLPAVNCIKYIIMDAIHLNKLNIIDILFESGFDIKLFLYHILRYDIYDLCNGPISHYIHLSYWKNMEY